jgi:hypothetical protein
MPKTRGSFKKGHKGFKPKGAVNKTTKESHELFMFIMNGEVEHIQESLTKIRYDDPEKYINALSKLLQYYIPRKTDVTSGDERISIQLPVIIIKTNGD